MLKDKQKGDAVKSYITKSFDEMTGKGEINTPNFRLLEDKFFLLKTETLDLSPAVVITENGEKIAWMVFTSTFREDWQFDRDLTMHVLMDGERARFDGILTYDDSQYDSGGNYWFYTEIAQMQVSLDFFRKASQAKELKLRVIGRDFILGDDIKEAMKELAEAAEEI